MCAKAAATAVYARFTLKTPSFSVVDDDGFYHCFGCGVHGDAISFRETEAGMEALNGWPKWLAWLYLAARKILRRHGDAKLLWIFLKNRRFLRHHAPRGYEMQHAI